MIRLAQDEAVPSLVIALWRMLLSTLILLPFTIVGRRHELGQMGRAKWGLAVVSGMLLGLHFATWTSSLAFTSITSSTVLVATAPLWVGLASPFLLNEPLARGLKAGHWPGHAWHPCGEYWWCARGGETAVLPSIWQQTQKAAIRY